MSRGPGGRVEQALVALVVISVCLRTLQNVLPRLLPSIVIVAVIVVVIRLVFDRTRPW